MKTHIESINSIAKKVTISFDAKECDQTRKVVLKKVQSQVSLPGFRKGKVPENILQQRFKEALNEEFQSELIGLTLKELKDKENFKVVAIKKIELVDLDQGKSLSMEVELEPDIELPDYKNFKLDAKNFKVTDAEIEEYINHLRKQNAEYKPVKRPCAPKDYVKISYEGFVNDQPIDDFENVPHLWCKQKSTWEEADSSDGVGIPEIVSGVVGMEVGSSKDITVTIPKTFQVEELQGKEAVYHVTLQEVREVTLPELDEDFFKKNHVKDLSELKDIAKKTLLERQEQSFASEQKHRISEFLIQSVLCELPESWVRNETEIVLQEMVNLFSSHGLNSEMLESQKTALFEKAQSVARDRIKLQLCFDKIFKKENLKVDAREVEWVLIQEAAIRHMSPEQLLHQVKTDERVRADIQRKAFQAKTINWIYQILSQPQASKN